MDHCNVIAVSLLPFALNCISVLRNKDIRPRHYKKMIPEDSDYVDFGRYTEIVGRVMMKFDVDESSAVLFNTSGRSKSDSSFDLSLGHSLQRFMSVEVCVEHFLNDWWNILDFVLAIWTPLVLILVGGELYSNRYQQRNIH